MFKKMAVSLTALTTAFLVSLLTASSAMAEYPKASLLVGAGQYIYDSERAVDDNDTGVIELGAGLVFDPTWALEFIYSDIRETDLDVGGELEGKSYRLDVLHHFAERNDLIPYLAAGVGHLELDSDASSSDDKDTAFNVGGGVKVQLTDALNLRGDLRAFRTWDDNHWDGALTFALTYVIGGLSSKPAAKPAPAPVAAAPVDSDGDGVYDDRDRCPNTPAGAVVDEDGCQIVIKETVEIELEVLFDTNKSVVKPAFFDEIKRVAEFMTLFPATGATIEGHTDARGNDDYNQALSQRRADAVKAVLVEEHGIAADRLKAVGYGESQPRATNDTTEGQAQNRRVVAEIKTEVEKKATQ